MRIFCEAYSSVCVGPGALPTLSCVRPSALDVGPRPLSVPGPSALCVGARRLAVLSVSLCLCVAVSVSACQRGAQIRVPPIQPGAFPFSRREPQTLLFGRKGGLDTFNRCFDTNTQLTTGKCLASSVRISLLVAHAQRTPDPNRKSPPVGYVGEVGHHPLPMRWLGLLGHEDSKGLMVQIHKLWQTGARKTIAESSSGCSVEILSLHKQFLGVQECCRRTLCALKPSQSNPSGLQALTIADPSAESPPVTTGPGQIPKEVRNIWTTARFTVGSPADWIEISGAWNTSLLKEPLDNAMRGTAHYACILAGLERSVPGCLGLTTTAMHGQASQGEGQDRKRHRPAGPKTGQVAEYCECSTEVLWDGLPGGFWLRLLWLVHRQVQLLLGAFHIAVF